MSLHHFKNCNVLIINHFRNYGVEDESNAVQKNAAEALAQMTGGEFYRFDSKKIEDRGMQVANHINNRYELSFHPSDTEPGFHRLQVEVNYPKMNVIAARTGYWVPDLQGSEGQGVKQ